MVNDLTVEGKSFNGEFIDEDEKIEVIRIDTYQIQVVRKKKLKGFNLFTETKPHIGAAYQHKKKKIFTLNITLWLYHFP